MAKQIVHGEESRQAILRGVNLLAERHRVIADGRAGILLRSGERGGAGTLVTLVCAIWCRG